MSRAFVSQFPILSGRPQVEGVDLPFKYFMFIYRDECLFPVEYNPKEFIFVNDRYFRIFKLYERVIVHFSQLTEKYVSCLAFGDSVTVFV